jgi:hypothetical protein
MSNKSLMTDYYIKQKPKLMAQFEKYLGILKDLLSPNFNGSEIEQLYVQMREEYERIIPEIPYIGGKKNLYTTMLVESVATLPIMRILEKEGLSYREIGKLIYDFFEIANKIRKRKLEKAGQDPTDTYFHKTTINYFKVITEKSQKKQYPDDWVWEFVEGEGKTFDYGFNVSECGIHKVFKRLGAEKYVPFICLADFATANVYEFGFTRTQTLGNGAPICDHRYLKNGKTTRGWPPENIEEYKME